MINFYYFLLGACLASFYFLLAMRLPLGQKIGLSRSQCDSCQETLGIWELIPILSFLLSKGRCLHCQVELPLAYPLYECLGGLFALVVCSRYSGVSLFINSLFYSILFLMAVIDHHHMIIPDSLQIALLLVIAAVPGNLHSYAGAAAMLGVSLASSLLVKDGLGGGDVKLLTILGFCFGYMTSAKILLGAASGGLICTLLKNEKSPIPFAPYLVVASFIIREFF